MFVCYGDASGGEDDRRGVILFTGLLSTKLRWRFFQWRWNRLLRKYGLSKLHMRNFQHVTRDWDDTKTRIFEDRVMGLLRCASRQTFVLSVDIEGYHAVNAIYDLKKELEGPYHLAASTCVKMVVDWMIENHPKHRNNLKWVYEKGDAGQGPLRDIVLKSGFPIKFVPKSKRSRPLEGADFIAWINRRHIEHMQGGSPVLHNLFERLRTKLPRQNELHHNQYTLTAFAKAHPEQAPPPRLMSFPFFTTLFRLGYADNALSGLRETLKRRRLILRRRRVGESSILLPF